MLERVTIAAAATFMLSALFLAMPAVTGNVSVLNSNPDANTETPANTNTDTNANLATSSNSNGALIETPATEQIANQAANARAANSTPANAAVTGNSTKPAANANKAPVKPAKK